MGTGLQAQVTGNKAVASTAGFTITIEQQSRNLQPDFSYKWRLWVARVNNLDSARILSKMTMTSENPLIVFDKRVDSSLHYWIDLESLPPNQFYVPNMYMGIMPGTDLVIRDHINTDESFRQSSLVEAGSIGLGGTWRFGKQSIRLRLRIGTTPNIFEATIVEDMLVSSTTKNPVFRTRLLRGQYFWVDLLGAPGWHCNGIRGAMNLSGVGSFTGKRDLLLGSCNTAVNSPRPKPPVQDSTPTIVPEPGIPSVQIGKQVWMQKNLAVTLYNDGRPIATGLSDQEWTNTTTGAYAVYQNKEEYNAQYGKLYNGFAVRTGKLCPKGWRIPTDADWRQLEIYIGMAAEELQRTGGRSELAEKLKAAGLWDESRYPQTNTTGFSALPAGIREGTGDYISLKQYANFWTSTPYENPYKVYLWNRHLYYNSNEIGRIYSEANKGLSCRCIKE
jgi:uncharacterized protein (TIGR02145 family)